MLKWFSKSENELYSKVKFVYNKFYFEDNSKPSKIYIPVNSFADVKINGKIVNGEVTFYANDTVSISYKNNLITEAKCEYNIDIIENEAKLTKTISKGKAQQFKPIFVFELNPKLEISMLEIVPKSSDCDELESMLRKTGLNGVFLNENISRIAISEEPITLSVVVSKKPIPGKPARFELIGTIENGHHLSNEQFFAQYVDESPGVAGYDIYGRKIEPEELFFFPEFGENVLVDDRGVISLKEGRLVFTPHLINVIEEQKVQKNFNWEDGLVEYDGDIVIDGDVKEGGQIKCTGNITINGGVFESYVFADGNIIIKGNVDQSVTYSGFSKLAAKQIESFSLQYLEIFERIMFESSFSAEDGYNYEEKTKSLELAKSEFLVIRQSIEPFLSLVQQFGSKEIIETYERFNQICIQGTKATLNDQSSSDDIKSEMEKFYTIIEDSKELLKDSLGTLQIASANTSHLFAYREVNITGTGTFQTIVESHNTVTVAGKCLSTSITSEQAVVVNEYNPGNNDDCKIIVKKKSGFIKINKLHSDSILQLADRKYSNMDDELNVYYDSSSFPKRR